MTVATKMLPRRVNDRERDTRKAGSRMLFDSTLPLRFWRKVYVDPSGCWLWTGQQDRGGYARLSIHGKLGQAHRFVYESVVAPIPVGLTLDHLCRRPPCVNPTHLEPVTRGTNVLRGIGRTAINARKTHCLRGHAFDAANTYLRRGSRHCRECRALNARQWRATRARA